MFLFLLHCYTIKLVEINTNDTDLLVGHFDDYRAVLGLGISNNLLLEGFGSLQASRAKSCYLFYLLEQSFG